MKIKIGNVIIGGKYIPIQTMIKNDIKNIDLTIKKINKLSDIGCDLIRVAVPDKSSIPSLKEIIKHSKIPVIADIHFDYKLALMSIDAGAGKIRINPGNIGDEKKIIKVIEAAKAGSIPIRIGINCGSLPKDILDKYPDDNIKTMIETAKEEIKFFNKLNYENIVLSFKSSNVLETILVNKAAKKEFNYPLHIGVTEAGDLIDGTVKNSIGISVLLMEGIGDTIRVSLTADEEQEIIVGKKILESTGKRIPEIEIISCPTCGRTVNKIDLIVKNIKKDIKNHKKLRKNIKIAVMGCIVNGPGEAKHADFGVACGKDKSMIFKDGKRIKIIKNDRILDELLIIMSDYYEEK